MTLELYLSEWLSKIGQKLGQKALYFELKHFIENNIDYLKPVNNFNHGSGKTTTLIQLARKYNAPIIVPSEPIARSIKNTEKDIDVYHVGPHLHGFRRKIVLCDEGINSKNMYEYVYPMVNATGGCVVGFVGWY